MEFDQEKFAMLIKGCGKRESTEGIKLRNQDYVKTHGEKETWLNVLEVDTIKQVKMKEKTGKKRKNFSKPNYVAEISSKG